MANWSNPVITSLYTDVIGELKGRDSDLAFGLDPATTSATSLVTNTIRWNSVNSYWEKYNGTSWAALDTLYNISVVNLNGLPSSTFLRLTGGGTQNIVNNVTLTGSFTVTGVVTVNTATPYLNLTSTQASDYKAIQFSSTAGIEGAVAHNAAAEAMNLTCRTSNNTDIASLIAATQAGSISFFTGGTNGGSTTTALTLDASQNATFAGNVNINDATDPTLNLAQTSGTSGDMRIAFNEPGGTTADIIRADTNSQFKLRSYTADYTYLRSQFVMNNTGQILFQTGGVNATSNAVTALTLNADQSATFAGAVTVTDLEVTGTLTASVGFPSGTRMLFQQTNAPTGWTKDTTKDNHALKVESGTVTSGGTLDFSTFLADVLTGSTTLTAAQIPQHRHTIAHTHVHSHTHTMAHTHSFDLGLTTTGNDRPAGGSASTSGSQTTSGVSTPSTGSPNNSTTGGSSATYSGYIGSSTGHTHSLAQNIKYVDVIIAEKD